MRLQRLSFPLLIEIIGAVFAVISAHVSVSKAQVWKQIGALPQASDLRCAYFWDTAHGVVGGVGCIYTYNSGTWTEAIYPEEPDTIKSLRLLDGQNLYAASGSTCIWKSSDSGKTWQKTSSLLPNIDDIYCTPDSQIHGMNLTGAGMMRGTSFARINALSCIAARDDDNTMAYSTDGGISWNSSNPPNNNWGYSCVADTCAGIFYTMTDGPKIELYSSSDGGNSWEFDYDFINNAVDVLDGGNSGVLYVQGTQNVYRSVYNPRTFQSIGGPSSTLDDRRMFAFGQYNRYLVEMTRGAVWLWDGSISYPALDPITKVNISPVDCSLSLFSITIKSTSPWDSIHFRAHALDGTSISPEYATLINEGSASNYYNYDTTLQYSVQIPIGKDTGAFYFQDTAWPGPTCNGYITWDTSFNFNLPKPPILALTHSIKYPYCQSGLAALSIVADKCDTVEIDSILFPPTSGLFLLDHQPPETILPGQKDTFWITISDLIPGKYTVLVHVYGRTFSSNAPIDTTLSIQVTVTGFSALPINQTVTVSNCRTSILHLFLNSLPCDSVIFTECILNIDKTLNYSTNLTFPLVISAADADTLLINFPAQNISGSYTISAHIKGQYLASEISFDTTLQIRVTFTSSAAALIPAEDAIGLDTITICDLSDSLVTFTNLGCDTITVTSDQTVWQAGWKAEDPSFPIVLAPDSSFTVLVHFAPTGPATSNQNLVYAFESLGGTSGKSSALTMTAVAIPAPASLMISDTALNFGSFTGCNAIADTFVTITNTGCDSLSLSGASVDAGAGFTLVSGTDTTLGTNQSAQYAIHFTDSITGSLASLFHVHGVGAHGGNAIDTTISLAATIVASPSMATISTTAIDFGTTSICEERDSSVSITVKGCESDTILSGDFSSQQFAFSDTTHFPIILPPNATATFSILTHLDTTGHPATITSTLNFTSDSGVSIPSVVLSRSVTYPGKFSLALSAPASAPISASVPIYVTRNGTVPSQTDEVDFDLIYNDDILSYQNSLEPDIKFTGQTKLANGLLDRSFAMKPASDRDTIAKLQFLSYLSKNDQTTIGLTHQQFLASGAVSPDCIAEMDTTSTPSNFQLELVCTDSLILAAMNDAPPFSIVNIQPNPATSSIEVGVRGLGFGVLEMELENILGQTVLTQHSALSTEHLDVSQIASGIYFLRLSENGYVQSRQVVIER